MKACIFDLDGTLLDSMGVWEEIDTAFLAVYGIEAGQEYKDALRALRFPEAAAYTIARYGLPETVESILRQWHEMALTAYATRIALKPHAREYLCRLKSCGIPLGIATSLSSPLLDAVFENHSLHTFFDVICTADMVPRGKEYPDIYLFTADKLSAAPGECLVFEDILPGIRSAKAAGMQVCGVLDPSSQADWPEIRRVADFALDDFKDAPLP